MIITVTGGSSSGKSAMAEDIAMSLEPGEKIYIATMQRATKEEDPIIERHRKLRAGKNFTTMECPLSPEKENIGNGQTALLECVANLLTNEMFGIADSMSMGLTAEDSSGASGRVINSIKILGERCRNLILVTNEVFSDGIRYDEAVAKYIKELGIINRALMEISDIYVESVYGIPYLYKCPETVPEYVIAAAAGNHGVFNETEN